MQLALGAATAPVAGATEDYENIRCQGPHHRVRPFHFTK